MTVSDQLKKLEVNLTKTIQDTVKNEVQQAEGRLFTKLNKQILLTQKYLDTSLEEKFVERQKELRDDILGYKDEIIGEIRDLRQENTVNSARITKLEKTILAN